MAEEEERPDDLAFEAELDKIKSKTDADPADKKEEAEALKAQEEVRAAREGWKLLRERRVISASVAKWTIRLTICYAPFPVFITFLNGFHVLGFSASSTVIAASFVPLGLGALVAVIKAVAK